MPTWVILVKQPYTILNFTIDFENYWSKHVRCKPYVWPRLEVLGPDVIIFFIIIMIIKVIMVVIIIIIIMTINNNLSSLVSSSWTPHVFFVAATCLRPSTSYACHTGSAPLVTPSRVHRCMLGYKPLHSGKHATSHTAAGWLAEDCAITAGWWQIWR